MTPAAAVATSEPHATEATSASAVCGTGDDERFEFFHDRIWPVEREEMTSGPVLD
jgi:hypothetical protein